MSIAPRMRKRMPGVSCENLTWIFEHAVAIKLQYYDGMTELCYDILMIVINR